jgi:chemotaxis protein methyltransferase CheR
VKTQAAKKNTFLNVGDFENHMRILQSDQQGFLALAAHLKKTAGINLPLNEKNLSLMASRLNKIMGQKQITTFTEFAECLTKDAELRHTFIEELTTNTTYFFREPAHFEMLKGVIENILKNKSKSVGKPDLRVWCAAASTGQEPYTILMTLIEGFGWPLPFNLKYLATDISTDVLQTASDGIYSEKEVEGLSTQQTSQFLTKVSSGIDDGRVKFKIQPQLKELVTFAPFNLLTEKYPFKNQFDIIFCRNVLIYFDRETTNAIVDKMIGKVNQGGYLFLGHSEAGMMKHPDVSVVAHAVYLKKV